MLDCAPASILVDKILSIPENQCIHESAFLNAVAEPVPVTGTPRPLWEMTL